MTELFCFAFGLVIGLGICELAGYFAELEMRRVYKKHRERN